MGSGTFATMSTLRRALKAAAGLILVVGVELGVSGCGPIEYIAIITFDASRSVAAAKGAKAAELAPYEYTAAVEYLHKARELGGFARYQQSVKFGRLSRDFAHKAFDIAKGKKHGPEIKKPAEEKRE
jgi:hypothetical protein